MNLYYNYKKSILGLKLRPFKVQNLVNTYRSFIFLTTLLSFTLLFSNCQNNEAVQQELFREVMVVHDEVMPKMDDIHRTQKQLRTKKTTITDATTQKEINDHIQALEQAGEGMMDWMAKLKPPSENDTRTHEEIMAYLAKEKIEIQHVSDDMNGSISAGKELLEKLTSSEN